MKAEDSRTKRDKERRVEGQMEEIGEGGVMGEKRDEKRCMA